MRARSSRATRHCSSGAVFTTSRIVTVSSVNVSTPHTSGSARIASRPSRRRRARPRSRAITCCALVDVGAVRDRDVEDRARPLLRLVADAVDLAVRDVPDDAFDVAQARRAQRDVFDRARRDAEVDDIADTDLVFEDDERAGDEVAEQVLRAERERDADEARAREQRRAPRCRAPTASTTTAMIHTMIDAKLARPRADRLRPLDAGASSASARSTRAAAHAGRPPQRVTLLSTASPRAG